MVDLAIWSTWPPSPFWVRCGVWCFVVGLVCCSWFSLVFCCCFLCGFFGVFSIWFFCCSCLSSWVFCGVGFVFGFCGQSSCNLVVCFFACRQYCVVSVGLRGSTTTRLLAVRLVPGSVVMRFGCEQRRMTAVLALVGVVAGFDYDSFPCSSFAVPAVCRLVVRLRATTH